MGLMVRRVGLSLAIWLIFGSVVGCAPGLRWVHDPPNRASCTPDRLPTWEDFAKRPGSGRRGAETAIRFVLFRQPAHIQAQFDHEHSWVRPEVAYSPNGSEHLLRHEQLHFAIGCLLAREANAALQSSDESEAMLLLVNAVATRLNVQYDSESNHGLDAEEQARWEKAIQARLKAGPLTKVP